MAGSMIDLQPLIARANSSKLEAQILDILDKAINALSPTELSAESTAGEIDKQYPADKGSEEAENYLWTLWSVYFKVAQKVPEDDPRQQLLVSVVKKLKAKNRASVQLWGQDTTIWTELPMFAPCMREAWDTRPSFNGTGQDASVISNWVSLNSFAARILGEEVQLWDNFAIWELRGALEEETSAPSAREAQLASAVEWLSHAGKYLYEKGRKEQKLEEHEARALRTGKLLDAKPGLSDERWKFWRERLAELGNEATDSDLKEKVEKTVKSMKDLEQ